MAVTTWSLFGTLENSAGVPQRGVTVTVTPPGLPFNAPDGTVISAAATAVSATNGYFSITVVSVPGAVWRIQVAGDSAVYMPDPGANTATNINTLTPAYVPAYQGGIFVPQGVGVSSATMVGSNLTLGLSNGTFLPPVPLLTSPMLDADGSHRASFSLQQAAVAGTVRVAVIGSSAAEGAGASTATSRWADQALAGLRATLAPSGDSGYGYIPAQYGAPSALAPTVTGTSSYRNNLGGLGARALTLGPDNGSTSTITWPAQQASKIRLYYGTDPTYKGSFQVLVDGAVVGTVSSNGAATRSGNVFIWTGPVGSHVLSVKWLNTVPTAAALVEGAHFSTSDSGVSLWDASRTGATAATIASGIANDGSQSHAFESLNTVNPHLVILNLGTQDMAAVPADAAAWGTRLASIVTQIHTACPKAGIIFVHDPMRLDDAASRTGTDSPLKLNQFEEAARGSIGVDPVLTTLNVSRLWKPLPGTTLAQQDPLGWIAADSSGPSDVAHLALAIALTNIVTGSIVSPVVNSISGRTGNVTLTAADIVGGSFAPSRIGTGTPAGASYVDGGTGAWTPLPQSGGTSSQRGMLPFRKALENGIVRVAVLGDSKTEGIGASDVAHRWQNLLRDGLRSTFFPGTGDQGAGYIPCHYGGWTPVGAPTIGGAEGTDWTQVGSDGGFGMREVQLNTTTAVVTFPASSMRYLTVYWTNNPFGTGKFTVSVDGVVQATITTTSAVPATGGQQMIDLGGVGVHTVTIARVTGSPRVNGVLLQTDQTGLTSVDAAHSGYFVGAYDVGNVTSGDLVSGALHDVNLGLLDPHLILIALGANDMSKADPAGLTAWSTGLTSLVGKLKTSCPNAGIVLLHSALRTEDARSATSTDYPGRLAAYEAAAQAAIGSDPAVTILHESALWQPLNKTVANPSAPVEQDPWGWLADSVHPSNVGHQGISGYLLDTLSEGIPVPSDSVGFTTHADDSADRSSRSMFPIQKAARLGTMRVVTLGDSKTEGTGATATNNRWQDVLKTNLRARYFPSGDTGFGYVPAQYQNGSFSTYNPTLTGATVMKDSKGGLGMRAIALGPDTGTSSTITWPAMTASKIRLYYNKSAFLNIGSFGVYVDGALVTTIDAQSGADTAGNIYTWTGTSGSHVLSVKWSATKSGGGTAPSSSAIIEGAHFSTADTGLSWYDGGHSGSRADIFAYGNLDYGEGGTQSFAYQSVAAVDPDLVIIGLGGNDMSGDFARTISGSEWAAALATMVAQIKVAAPRAGIILLHAAMRIEDARSAISGRDYPGKLLEFEEAARQAIGADERVSIAYESALWQPLNGASQAAQDPWGWLSDSIHPSDAGHSAIAAYLDGLIGNMVETAPSSLSNAQIDAHLGGNSTNLLTTVNGKAAAVHAANHLAGGSDPITAFDGNSQTLKVRRDSWANLQSVVLAVGEIAFVQDTHQGLFIGDGTNSVATQVFFNNYMVRYDTARAASPQITAIPKAGSAAASSALTVTSTATNVAGATFSIYPLTSGYVKVTGTFDITVATTGDQISGSLTVNGSAQTVKAIYQPATATARATVSAAWSVSVSASTAYVFNLQAQRTAGTGTTDTVSTNTTLDYEYVPGATLT